MATNQPLTRHQPGQQAAINATNQASYSQPSMPSIGSITAINTSMARDKKLQNPAHTSRHVTSHRIASRRVASRLVSARHGTARRGEASERARACGTLLSLSQPLTRCFLTPPYKLVRDLLNFQGGFITNVTTTISMGLWIYWIN